MITPPAYLPIEPRTFDYRLIMCEYMAEFEGTELGDALRSLCCAASILNAWCDYHNEATLLLAEDLCRNYVKNVFVARQCDWEEYKEIDPNVLAHFGGGASKLSEKEFKELQEEAIKWYKKQSET